MLDVINKSVPSPTARSTAQIDPRIKQLQSELKLKVQTFGGKRIDPREECGPPTEIRKLVKQFDPLDDNDDDSKSNKDLLSSTSPVTLRLNHKPTSNICDRHPSLNETIPNNHVSSLLQNIQSNYGTPARLPQFSPGRTPANNLIRFPILPPSTSVGLIPRKCSIVPEDSSPNFDPLAPVNEKPIFSNLPSQSSPTHGSNLIDFN